MNPSEQHNQEDLERLLRDAFAAKALQISDTDLDREREDDVAAALSSRRRPRPVTRLFAGIGAAAAAAAIVAVTVVGLHTGGTHETVDGLPPAMTTSSASTTPSTTTSSQEPTSSTKPPSLNQPATPGNRRGDALPSTGAGTSGTSGTSAPQSETRTPSTTSSAAPPSSSTATSGSSSQKLTAAAQKPPAISEGLPQSSALGDQEYSGAVPLKDPTGGTTRMLSMPSDLTWQRTAEDANSLTVRMTFIPTDIEAYWRRTLPSEGWVQNGSGWSYPGTSYAVSPITDKGSFTVTW